MRIAGIRLQFEEDVVTARKLARDVARLVGFDAQQQARIATAVSELARVATAASESARAAASFRANGDAAFFVEGTTAPQMLIVKLRSAAFAAFESPPKATSAASAECNAGVVAARRLMDRFEVSAADGSPVIVLTKIFPRNARALRAVELAEIEQRIKARGEHPPKGMMDELEQQNRELADTLQQLQERERELSRLNAELFDTNRGVLALYAELDDKAEHLRNADQLKTKFLSNMSHEFRTPLNSILGLTRILIDRIDGDLGAEQEKQIGYIRKSAHELLELVNDLLDLAKVEAGKVVLRPVQFDIDSLFSSLRGMLRPLLVSQTLALVFEDASALPELYADESKVAQVLRNFLSNALKFTQKGEIRVSARLESDDDHMVLSVADTGIGIALEDQERIFEEFSQIDNPLQKTVHGTGLGLPLCRKLAQVMRGSVGVESAFGSGSTFFLRIPLQFPDTVGDVLVAGEASSALLPVLVVEDRADERLIIEAHLKNTSYYPVHADRIGRAAELLSAVSPVAAILDISLQGEDSWQFLPRVKEQDVPVVVVSALDESRKGLSLGADAWGVKPVEREWLVGVLDRLIVAGKCARVLVVDDDALTREALESFLKPHCRFIAKAADGVSALAQLRREVFDLVVVDYRMQEMDGFGFIDHVRSDSRLAALSVVLCTSQELSGEEHAKLVRHRVAFLSKSALDSASLCSAAVQAIALARSLPPAQAELPATEAEAVP